MFQTKSLYSSFIIGLLIVSLALPLGACGHRYNLPKVDTAYYPQCVAPFNELIEAQYRLVNRTAASAAVGAAMGALIVGLTSRSGKGALIGGIIGLLAAGTVSYVSGKQSQIRDVRQRLRSYQSDMYADIYNMNLVELYALECLDCYIREFKTLMKDFKAHRISEDEVKKRYAEIKQGMTAIGSILDDAYAQSAQRDAEFKAALNSERQLAKKTAREYQLPASIQKQLDSLEEKIERTSNIDPVVNIVKNQTVKAEQNKKRQELKDRGLSKQAEVSLDELSNDFDSNYKARAANLELAGALYEQTLSIMDNSALDAGLINAVTTTNSNSYLQPWQQH